MSLFSEEYHFTNSWSNLSECDLYQPRKQYTQKNLKCGNGFRYAYQDQCVMGNDNLEPENQDYCPKPGFFVMDCYVPCSGIFFFFLLI